MFEEGHGHMGLDSLKEVITRSQYVLEGGKQAADVSMEDSTDEIALQSNADIWVTGDSIPFWAGHHAMRTGKPNLGLQGQSTA